MISIGSIIMKETINELFDNIINELKSANNKNRLLRNLQFHVTIDVMGYISMPEQNSVV